MPDIFLSLDIEANKYYKKEKKQTISSNLLWLKHLVS